MAAAVTGVLSVVLLLNGNLFNPGGVA